MEVHYIAIKSFEFTRVEMRRPERREKWWAFEFGVQAFGKLPCCHKQSMKLGFEQC